MEDRFRKIIDWFLNKSRTSQVIVLLLLIISYLGYNYYENQKLVAAEVVTLREDVRKQDSTISDLTHQLESARLNSILLKASEDTSPVPMFLVDVSTFKVLWVNVAYEKKYLIPNFTNREEFIGTDGSYVFGEDEVLKFHNNNRMVFQLQKPMTFTNEVNTTITKFPVTIGDYTYAIGGIEYIKFN